MALPKLNVLPKFELTIPSTGKVQRFRPYLVKEEKILLLAFESKDANQMIDAMVDIITSCSEERINTRSLTTFDVEYLFTQIRTKSSGEIVKLNLKCDNCEEENEVSLNLENITVDMPKIEKIIKLTPEISVEMKWPNYKAIMNNDTLSEEISVETMFELVAQCIAAILTPEERFDAMDSTPEELGEFIESLTSDQFAKMSLFLSKMPKMKTDIEYDCTSCGHLNSLKVEGLSDFF